MYVHVVHVGGGMCDCSGDAGVWVVTLICSHQTSLEGREEATRTHTHTQLCGLYMLDSPGKRPHEELTKDRQGERG